MNVAVLTRPPEAVPVIVMAKVPVGVVARVAIAIVEVKVRVPLAGVKVAVAPAGRPEADNVTVCVRPESSVAVTVADVPLP